MQFIVTGGTGLLGSEFVSSLKAAGKTVFAPESAILDITDPEKIADNMPQADELCVVHCAGLVDVDACEADQERCFAVNTHGTENMLSVLAKRNKPAVFVFVSSSEVFGRVKKGEFLINGYTEDDEPRPVTAYQRSKRRAEEIVEEYQRHYDSLLKTYIVRAGWLYGAGRQTFVDHFVSALQKPEELTAVKDQWRSPTWTKHFVLSVLDMVEKDMPSGIYHAANEAAEGEATTPQVVAEIAKFLGREKVKAKIKEISREGFFKVPRAPSNVIKNTKLPKLPSWRQALREYLQSSGF